MPLRQDTRTTSLVRSVGCHASEVVSHLLPRGTPLHTCCRHVGLRQAPLAFVEAARPLAATLPARRAAPVAAAPPAGRATAESKPPPPPAEAIAAAGITLPVFFYNSTKLPGGTIELCLFEPRYRTMMQRIVGSDRKFCYL